MSLTGLIVFCAGWWMLGLSVRIGSIGLALLQPAIRPRQATRRDQPPVSALVPVSSLDAELESAFHSLFSQDYPHLEVLVSAADESCPAMEVARRVAARFPQVKVRFLSGQVDVARCPKLNNLATSLPQAGHELLFVKDANVWLAPEQLAEFVRYHTPGVGLVCAVPIAAGPATFAAEVECAMINGHAAPLLLAVSALGWGFGYGKAMLFDREDFRRAGGVAAIARALTEDHPLSKALARIGLRTVFAGTTVRQTVGARTFRDVWPRQLRWMVFRRLEAPLAFYLEPFFGFLSVAYLGAVGAPVIGLSGWVAAAGTGAVWFGLEALFLVAKGWGISWRSPFAALFRELMIPALWLQAWISRRIYWDGTALEIRPRSA